MCAASVNRASQVCWRLSISSTTVNTEHKSELFFASSALQIEPWSTTTRLEPLRTPTGPDGPGRVQTTMSVFESCLIIKLTYVNDKAYTHLRHLCHMTCATSLTLTLWKLKDWTSFHKPNQAAVVPERHQTTTDRHPHVQKSYYTNPHKIYCLSASSVLKVIYHILLFITC